MTLIQAFVTHFTCVSMSEMNLKISLEKISWMLGPKEDGNKEAYGIPSTLSYVFLTKIYANISLVL